MGYTQFIKVRDDLAVCFNVQEYGIHFNTNKTHNSSKLPKHMTINQCINQLRNTLKDTCS